MTGTEVDFLAAIGVLSVLSVDISPDIPRLPNGSTPRNDHLRRDEMVDKAMTTNTMRIRNPSCYKAYIFFSPICATLNVTIASFTVGPVLQAHSP